MLEGTAQSIESYENSHLKRVTLSLFGLKYINVACDWFMSLPWFFLLGPGVWITLGVVCHSTPMQLAFEASTAFQVLQLIFFTTGITACWFLWRTVVCDPGFCFEEDATTESTNSPNQGDDVTRIPIKKTGSVYGRPHKCPVCKIKMKKYDHHCGVIGACICKYTMGTFILFLFFAALTCFIGWCFCVTYLYQTWPGLSHFRREGVSVWESTAIFRNFECVTTMILCFIGIYGGSYTCVLFLTYIFSVFKGDDCHALRRAKLELVFRAFREGNTNPGPSPECESPSGWGNVVEVLSHVARQKDAHYVLRQV